MVAIIIKYKKILITNMKCSNLNNDIIKNIIFSTLFFFLLNIILTNKNTPRVNVYKTDKAVKHSLFKEKDSIDRLSVSHEGVPEKKK